MKKLLTFEIKNNLHRAARVYVKSPNLKVIFGSFSMDNTGAFDGWDELTIEQTIELKQFIQNVNAINEHLQHEHNNTLTDFRFRLPVNVINTLNSLSALCHKEDIDLNVYDSMVLNIIQQMKIASAKLSDEAKIDAFNLLEKAGIAEYKKQDYRSQIQAIFTELLNIQSKSEKLHSKANALFEKDKSYSHKAIESMATGDSRPSRWLVACAIDVLIDEKIDLMRTLSEDNFFVLWAKPQIDHDIDQKSILSKIELMSCGALRERIKSYLHRLL